LNSSAFAVSPSDVEELRAVSSRLASAVALSRRQILSLSERIAKGEAARFSDDPALRKFAFNVGRGGQPYEEKMVREALAASLESIRFLVKERRLYFVLLKRMEAENPVSLTETLNRRN